MSDHTTTMPDTAIIAGMVELERLRKSRDELLAAYSEAIHALRATDALLDPMLMEHGNRIDDNAPIITAYKLFSSV